MRDCRKMALMLPFTVVVMGLLPISWLEVLCGIADLCCWLLTMHRLPFLGYGRAPGSRTPPSSQQSEHSYAEACAFLSYWKQNHNLVGNSYNF